MSASKHDTMSEYSLKCKQQNVDIAKAAAKLATLLSSVQSGAMVTLLLTGSMVSSYLKERKAIRTTRAFMESCDKQCETGACIGEIYDDIKSVRDNYVALVKIFPQTSLLLALHRKHAEKMLIEWDDLVEDSFIASDPEIRASICRIAKLC